MTPTIEDAPIGEHRAMMLGSDRIALCGVTVTRVARLSVRLVAAILVAAVLASAPAQAKLVVVDVDTGKRTQISTAAPSEGWASLRWAADGSALIGVANDELDLSIRRYPVTGGRAKVLRTLPDAFDAVLNRDGTKVAALYDTGVGGSGGVLVRDVATGRTSAQLPQSAEGDELYENGLNLTWAPDSSRVAYHAHERRGETVRIADARSGRVVRRLDARTGIYETVFSPDGDRLLYTGGTYGKLTVIDIASGASRRIASTALAPAWAPAGNRIAFSAEKSVAVTGEDQQVASTTPIASTADTLLWSPDGRRLALIMHDEGGDYHNATLAVLVPGAKPRVLLAGTGIWTLTWSADGSRLAYSA